MDKDSVPVETKRMRATVHGRVQGVGFRAAVVEKALYLGVVGSVSNRWDGTVEVIAEGEDEALQKLLAWLHVGPRMARVTRVQVLWESPQGEFDDFEVRP
jgi:acylphosphatase